MSNDKVKTTTDIELVRGNWKISTRGPSKGLYALAILNTRFTGINGGSNQVGVPTNFVTEDVNEFIFDVNPQSMQLDEPAAVSIVPTQDGSQFIEHQGGIYKNLTLTGTTGLRPNKSQAQSLIPVIGFPNPFSRPDIDPVTQLPAGEKSGFERLMALRNLFRRYLDFKRNPAVAHQYVMVWQNGKEGEWFVVEPMSFRTRRDSGNPLTAHYEIQLRTIKRFDLIGFTLGKDSRRNATLIARFNERVVKITRELANAIRIVEGLEDRLSMLMVATRNNVIVTPQKLAISAKNIFNKIISLQTAKQSLALTKKDVKDFGEAVTELMTIGSADLSGTAYRDEGVSTQLSDALGAYKNMLRVAANIYSEDKLFGETIGTRLNRRTVAYKNRVSGYPITGGNQTDLRNTGATESTAIATVADYDTIFTLAHRLLGDQSAWKTLVILNGLKSPYISTLGNGKEVLRPHDKILYPTTSIPTGSGVVPDSTSDDPIVRRLGRDLKLVAYESAGGLVQYDLAINSRGDLATVEGLENMEQAVRIKFSTEQGTLPTHPEFGIQVPIGSKALVRTLVGFHLNARASLLSDSRISDVNRLNFSLNGNTVTVQANLQIADIDEGVAVSFDARR